jgi:large subunit ribosomal protein L6
MSRTGKLPIEIPKGVEVTVDGLKVAVKGPKGNLAQEFLPGVTIVMEENNITVTRESDLAHHRSIHGLTRSLINNMVVGVSQGFEKSLEVRGVGYRAKMEGSNVVLNVGYSHPVVVKPPEGISFEVDEKKNIVKILGINNQLVGQVTADMRKVRPVEPYKGKGIRYLGEHVVTKVGKRAK